MEIELTGVIYEGEFVSEKYKNAIFPYAVHIPECANGKEELGLILTHDGLNKAEAYAAEKLAQTGEAPCCVTVGVTPGFLPATIEEGYKRNLRMNTYDMFLPDYPEFIVDELLPYLIAKYGLKISDSPDMHLVCGGSSGGLSAWNIAWQKNNYFRRVYMNSPSFVSMGKGDELISLIRKFETKPIRVFTEYSEDEPDKYFGSSYCVGEAAARALKFSGYDVMCEYYPGESHCSRNENPESAIERMKFLWKDWKDCPVIVKGRSESVDKVVASNGEWIEISGDFPEEIKAISTGRFTAAGEYVADKSKIIFIDDNGNKRVVADNFECISSLQISSDKWRLYIGDKKRACIYAATIEKDGSLSGIYTHCALHQNTDFDVQGALAMCVDNEDRLYVATEVGIQTIRSFGMIDVILTNPFDNYVKKLEIGEDGYLYAKTADKTYKRKLENKSRIKYDVATQPKFVGYND